MSTTPPTTGVLGNTSSKSTIIAVASVVGFLVVCTVVILILRRNRIQKWFTDRRGERQGNEQPLMAQTAASGSTLQLVGGRLQTVPTSSSEASTPATTAAAGRPRFRYNQRQDSGASVRSIPTYSLAPGDEELVLMKPRESSDFSVETHGSAESPDLRRVGTASSEESSVESSAHLTLSRYDSNNPLLDPPTYVYRSRANSASNVSGFVSVDLESGRPSFDTLPGGLASPSSFASRSTASLALPGRPSLDIDTSGTSNRRSFFRGKGPSASVLPTHWKANAAKGHRATRSASSLVISSPIRDTLVRSDQSYVYPKSGITPQQMSFISSRESLALIGVSTPSEPPAFEDLPEPVPLPSFAPSASHTDLARIPEPASASLSRLSLGVPLSVPLPEESREELQERSTSRASMASTTSFETAHTHDSSATLQ